MTSIDKIDLNLLRILHLVMEEGSVRRAAELCHVTPAAVSNSLAKLRFQLGDPLLVRSGRVLRPTPVALQLEPKLRTAMQAISVALDSVGFDPATCSRTFVVAATDNIAFDLLPAAIRLLSERMPKASIKVVSLDHAIAGDGLRRGTVDVSLAMPPNLPPDFHAEPAYRETMVGVLAAAAAPRTAGLTNAQFDALSHIEVAINGEFAIDYVDRMLGNSGRRRKVALSVPTFMAAATCAAESNYLAILPQRLATFLSGPLALKVLQLPFRNVTVELEQVWHDRTNTDPASMAFRRLVTEAGGRLG